MNIKKIIFTFLTAIALTSCAFVPSSSTEQPYYFECEMVTKKLMLETTQMGQINDCGDGGIAECLIMTGILGTASLIVSGSIVLIGNTLHWSEYKLRC